MHFKVLSAVSAAAFIFLWGSSDGMNRATAASAVMVDKGAGIYGYCSGADDAFAAMTCARKKCEAAGGQRCEITDGCPVEGHGAIALDENAPSVGSSCGKPDSASARSVAMQRCAQGGVNCRVVKQFSDLKGESAQPPARQTTTAPPPAAAGSAPTALGAAPAARPANEDQARAQAAREAAEQAAQMARAAAEGDANRPQDLAQEAAQAFAAAERERLAQEETPPPAQVAPQAGGAAQNETPPPASAAPQASDATKGVVQALRDKPGGDQVTRADKKKLTDEQLATLDRLVGVWSSVNCAEKFWRITKAGPMNYKVFVWYEDGQEDNTEFTVSFEEDYIVLTWNTRLPNAHEGKKRGRRYVEKILRVEDDSYLVAQNNYKDFDRSWLVNRCTDKR